MGDNPNNSQLGKNYILIGPQGSGKGTQAKILSQKYNLQHISTGDLLREISQVQSVLGDKIKKLVNSGELIPDEMLMEVFQNELQAIDKTRGILLDGIPRTLNQAKLLDNVFTEENLPLPKAINININQQAAVDRVTKRRTCKRCQTPYLPTDSSAISGICEACGGEVAIREDDNIDAIKRRLNLYYKETEPILDYYYQSYRLIKINGEQPIPDVTDEIIKTIENDN